MAQFETRISGIPCICNVLYYDQGTNFYITSQSMLPNEDEIFDFEILDRHGYKAAWLEAKVTEDDVERIYLEFFEYRAKCLDDDFDADFLEPI